MRSEEVTKGVNIDREDRRGPWMQRDWEGEPIPETEKRWLQKEKKNQARFLSSKKNKKAFLGGERDQLAKGCDKPRREGENIGLSHKEVTGGLDKSNLGGRVGTRV